MKRLRLKNLLSLELNQIEDGKDVIKGLSQTPKTLPSHYFYDSYGSQLFEQICQLPEYYPTRTEAKILQQYSEEIAEVTQMCELVELGSGSSTKTRFLLDAYQKLGSKLRYCPIDVSSSILKESALNLLNIYPNLEINGLIGTYEIALANLPPAEFKRRLVIFLGSTIGNLNPVQCDNFFALLTSSLTPGDYFLLGIDLQKPRPILEAAYNDSQGITAAFNLNILQHLNWRFNGNFNLALFEHQAFYNEVERQIEMHLLVKQNHSVYLDTLDFQVNFLAGETIRTEISRKFDLGEMKNYLEKQGLIPLKSWTDEQEWFGLILAQNKFSE